MVKRPILVFGEYGTINGGENSLLAVIPTLQQFGWRFVAAVPQASGFANALAVQKIANRPFSFASETGERKTQSEIRKQLEQLITTTNPCLVHCNSLSASRICGPVSRSLQIPSIGYLRDILNLSRKAISDINQIDRIVAVSHATSNWHIERGMDPEKVQVVHNGINPRIFQSAAPSTLPQELGISDDQRVLLSVGQISMRKGLDVLLESFQKIAAVVDDVHLIVVGKRHSIKDEAIAFEQQLHKAAGMINDSSGGQRVHFAGVREDVPGLMKRCDILIHVARQEPLGRVLLEACAAGLPVVATDAGGTREILAAHDGSGFDPIVPVDDSSTLSGRVLELLSSNSLCEDSAQRNLQEIHERFSVERCATALNSIYSELLKDGSLRP